MTLEKLDIATLKKSGYMKQRQIDLFVVRVRNITSCPGNSECNYGIIDTYEMGGLLDKEFFGEDMPVKIKFAVTGCPNACAKPQENDFGVRGVRKPAIKNWD